MSAQNEILALLKVSSAQSPMPFDVLSMKSGLPPSELEQVLDGLYDTRAINRCTVTRDGCTTMMVWPTGMMKKIAFRTFAINPRKPVSAEFKPTVKADKSTLQKQEQTIMEPEKSKARIMLEIIAEKGAATFKELIAASGASSVAPFIKGPVGRGEIIIEGLNGTKRCRLAPGVTGENLLSGGRKKSSAHIQSSPEVLEAPSTPAPTSAPTPTPVDHVADAIDMIEHWEDAQIRAKTSAAVPARPRFRVAVTSDKTILLFGLSQEPIELDREQALILAGFISERDILCA